VTVICAAVNGDIAVILPISVGKDVKTDRAILTLLLLLLLLNLTLPLQETVIARVANVAVNTAIAERLMRTVVLDVKADRAPMEVATTITTTEATIMVVAIPIIMPGRLSLLGTVLLIILKDRAFLDLVVRIRLQSTIMELPL